MKVDLLSDMFSTVKYKIHCLRELYKIPNHLFQCKDEKETSQMGLGLFLFFNLKKKKKHKTPAESMG